MVCPLRELAKFCVFFIWLEHLLFVLYLEKYSTRTFGLSQPHGVDYHYCRRFREILSRKRFGHTLGLSWRLEQHSTPQRIQRHARMVRSSSGYSLEYRKMPTIATSIIHKTIHPGRNGPCLSLQGIYPVYINDVPRAKVAGVDQKG